MTVKKIINAAVLKRKTGTAVKMESAALVVKNCKGKRSTQRWLQTIFVIAAWVPVSGTVM